MAAGESSVCPGNLIGEYGAAKLAVGMSKNRTLLVLELPSVHAAVLVRTMFDAHTGNRIHDAGAIAIAKVMACGSAVGDIDAAVTATRMPPLSESERTYTCEFIGVVGLFLACDDSDRAVVSGFMPDCEHRHAIAIGDVVRAAGPIKSINFDDAVYDLHMSPRPVTITFVRPPVEDPELADGAPRYVSFVMNSR